MENPRTIHDFYGFPSELYEIEYNAKGSKEIAELIKETVKSIKVGLDTEWGLDHGTWSILKHMYPKADIPVLQLSLDYHLPLEAQYQIGKELNSLRNKGILIIGSGNLVHNLTMMNPLGKPFPWAVDFDNFVKTNLEKRDDNSLIDYMKNKSASISHPSNDHYLPLMYVLGAAGKEEKPKFFNEKIVLGSVGMRCILFWRSYNQALN